MMPWTKLDQGTRDTWTMQESRVCRFSRDNGELFVCLAFQSVCLLGYCHDHCQEFCKGACSQAHRVKLINESKLKLMEKEIELEKLRQGAGVKRVISL